MSPPPILSHADEPMRAVEPDGPDDGPVVVLAPNAFKGSLSARLVADAMEAGVRDALPSARIRRVLLADGGDGSIDALLHAGFARAETTTRGPTGVPVASAFAVLGGTAVVELASSCGLALLPGGRPAPLDSSTAGLGDAIRGALDTGPERLVICVGGSASTDGGAGMLGALGAMALDRDGGIVQPSGRTLADIATIDLTGLDPRLARVHVRVATDVTSPLLGPTGAAAVFAPQKGADADQVAMLESGLSQWAHVLEAATGVHASDTPGAGAAGGTALAAISALGADVISGARFISEAVGQEASLRGADLVVTGEGSLDEQSLLGKGVGAVCADAARHGIAIAAVCGRFSLTDDQRGRLGLVATAALVDETGSGLDPIRDAAVLVRRATARVVRDWSAGDGS